MEIPREYFCQHIFEGFYRRKYSIGIYRGNYSGKKNKTKQKNDDMSFLTTELPTENSVGKIVGKL